MKYTEGTKVEEDLQIIQDTDREALADGSIASDMAVQWVNRYICRNNEFICVYEMIIKLSLIILTKII